MIQSGEEGLLGAVTSLHILFYPQLLQPLHHRFTSLVQHPDLQSHSQDGSTQQALLAILESLCGLAQSARPDSVPEFFGFMFPFLQVAVSLLEVFSDVVEVTEVILELFALVSENYTVFLNEVRSERMLAHVLYTTHYTHAHTHIHMYMHTHTHKISINMLIHVRTYSGGKLERGPVAYQW